MNSDHPPLRRGTHTITVNGLAQRYHVHGQGPICLVHPGGPGLDWQYLRMPSLEQHLTTVYLEPIGTGDSGQLPSHPTGYTLDRYVEQLHGVIEHLDRPRVHLLGHSYGGFIELQYALKHSERLDGLILYDTAPLNGAELRTEALRNLRRIAELFAGRAEIAEILTAFEQAPAPNDAASTARLRTILPVYFADYGADLERFEPLRRNLRAWYVEDGSSEPFDVVARLPSISNRTLVLVGRHDFICGTRWARLLHEHIPDSTLVTFEDSGHLSHIEQPKAFVEAITTFLHRRATGSANATTSLSTTNVTAGESEPSPAVISGSCPACHRRGERS